MVGFGYFRCPQRCVRGMEKSPQNHRYPPGGGGGDVGKREGSKQQQELASYRERVTAIGDPGAAIKRH